MSRRLRQTVLTYESNSQVIFARFPTEVELAEQQLEYERNAMEMEKMLPDWYEEVVEIKDNAKITDFYEAKWKTASDAPAR